MIQNTRLRPILFQAIEETLRRGVSKVGVDKALKLYVFTPVGGIYRVIASTVSSDAPVRQLELQPDQGVVGFTADQKVPCVAPLVGGVADVLNRAGEKIGEQRKLRPVNAGKVDVDLKWIYARPIFERPPQQPWSDRVVGVLTVDSSDPPSGDVFKSPDFQSRVDLLATEIAPYLEIAQALFTRPRA